MNLAQLVAWAKDKERFQTIDSYSEFCAAYLEFIFDGLQAVIVSQKEQNYSFFQYKEDGSFNVTRPINRDLMYSVQEFAVHRDLFDYALKHIHDIKNDIDVRTTINRFAYTCQQSIGAALDALPTGMSNTARKVNGDLFERYIRLIIRELGIQVRDGIVQVPIVVNGEELCKMTYQHDLIVEENGELKAIGSVKTSSKDRLDKIFVDKFLYNQLTNSSTPHFAVFLNDVQRKGREPNYGINSTFLAGHFKGYSIKLNPLDGVYYCDLRPNMRNDELLRTQIRSFDHLLVEDIWNFI